MPFKDRLKELREELSLTQKDVALNCNLSTQCISQLEAGTRNPTGSTLLALADCFDCSIDFLMGRKDDPDDIDLTSPYGSQNATLSQKNELLQIFQALPAEYKIQILEYARYIAERNKNTKRSSKR